MRANYAFIRILYRQEKILLILFSPYIFINSYIYKIIDQLKHLYIIIL